VLARPRATSLVLSMTAVPAAIALPVLTIPRPHPHAVAPVIRTIAVTPTSTLAAPHAAPRAALPQTSTQRFDLVGARWQPGTLVATDHIEVRVRTGGTWSGWNKLEPADYGPDAGTREDRLAARAKVTAAEPLWVQHADGVQARVNHADGTASAGPRDLTLVVVDPGSSGADSAVGATAPLGGAVASASTGQPSIYTRAQWGADESLRKKACPAGPDYNSTVKIGFVHHTDTSNGYSSS
jgi:hypothetical protein